MAYLPSEIPGPEPTIDDAPFWRYCDARELRFQRCADCSRFRHPPAPACPHCQSLASEWVKAPEQGELFSFTVVHHPAHPAISPVLPYNVAIVAFPECDGLHLISNIVDVRPEELTIGMRVGLTWETAGNGHTVPRFRRL